MAGRWQARWGGARVCLGVQRGTDLLAAFGQGALRRWKLSCSKGAGTSRQWRAVSGLFSLVLCLLWVYLVNSCPSLFQMVTRTKKIFVGGLSVNTTVEDVKQYFEQFGKVSLLSGVGSKLLLLGQKGVF